MKKIFESLANVWKIEELKNRISSLRLSSKYFKSLLLISFFLMDYFLMQINYMAWLPFAGLLYFSRYTSLPLQERDKYFSNTLAN